MLVPGSVNPLLMMQSGDPLDEFGKIDHAVRLNASDSSCFTLSYAAPTDGKKWTLVLRGKRTKPDVQQIIFSAGSGVSNTDIAVVGFDANNNLIINSYNGVSAFYYRRISNKVYRDFGAHYDICIGYDSTASDPNKLVVSDDGVVITSWKSGNDGYPLYTEPTLNAVSVINSALAHAIGRSQNGGGAFYSNDYAAQVVFIDGNALPHSSFGLVHPRTNQWRTRSLSTIKALVDAGGVNSRLYDFADGSVADATHLGKDASAKGNNATPVNISVAAGSGCDYMTDTPTRNHPTFDVLDVIKVGTRTLANGNLELTSSLGGGRATIPLPSSGKWVFEGGFTAAPSGNAGFGICQADSDISGGVIATNAIAYNCNGNKTTGGAYSAFGATYNNTNVVRVEADCDAKSAEFFKDGVSQGTISFSSLTGSLYFMHTNASSVSVTAWMNFGQRALAGTPTGGFKTLNAKNMAFPKVSKSSSAFVSVTDSGANIAATLAAARSGWSAYIDIVKRRDPTLEGWRWIFSDDTTYYIDSAGTAAKAAVPAFGGTSYIGYSLKVSAANGVATGRLSHTNGVADVVTDGLSNSRKVVMLRNEAGGDWFYYHPDLTAGKLLYLNQNAGETTDASINSITASGFTVAAALATGTYRWVSIAETEGVCKLFKYSGNGSNDGPNPWCAGQPAMLSTKRIDTGGNNHYICDTTRNPNNNVEWELYFDLTAGDQDQPTFSWDLLSGSVKVRGTNIGFNTSGAVHVCIAFLKSAFRYSNAH